MAAPYGLELRGRIVGAYATKEGSIRDLAKRFGVSPKTVQNYCNLLRRTGSLAPRPHGGGVKPRIEPQHLEAIRDLLRDMPDAIVAELTEAFAQRCHVKVSPQTMARALQRARRGHQQTPLSRAGR